MGMQFVVQLENRPGALGQLARALAVRGVNIVHIAGGGAGELGYAVLSTDDDEATRAVLRSTGLTFVEGAPLMVELEDRPGALADAAERLATAGVDVRGLLICGRREGRVEVAVTVDDVERARGALGLG